MKFRLESEDTKIIEFKAIFQGMIFKYPFLTLILTSPAFGGSTSISSMDKGFLASHAIAALHLITWKLK